MPLDYPPPAHGLLVHLLFVRWLVVLVAELGWARAEVRRECAAATCRRTRVDHMGGCMPTESQTVSERVARGSIEAGREVGECCV